MVKLIDTSFLYCLKLSESKFSKFLPHLFELILAAHIWQMYSAVLYCTPEIVIGKEKKFPRNIFSASPPCGLRCLAPWPGWLIRLWPYQVGFFLVPFLAHLVWPMVIDHWPYQVNFFVPFSFLGMTIPGEFFTSFSSLGMTWPGH